MQKKVLLLVAAVLLTYAKTSAQDNLEFQSFLIDSSLTKDANAVIRSEEILVEINSVNSLTIKTKRVVTVLNKYGEKYADWYERYSPSVKIKELEVKIYDVFGKEIKKYKRKDFGDRSVYDGISLMNDDRIKYVDYTATGYPYTVVFESEIESTSTAFLPQWMPVSSSKTSLEKSTFIIKNNTGIKIRFKEINFESFPIEKNTSENQISYTLSSISGRKYEALSPSYIEQIPILMVALNNFSLEGVEGEATDWKSFGKWQYDKLLDGRNKLSPETITEIEELVKNASTKKEKAKLIYEYVQKKTRYISIQLGIGGWMPFIAGDVDRLGYGDCKALTNYTKALLDTQDIDSYYTVVFANERRDIDPDFASMQGNHVILNIPDENEDLWLECTSQTLPFNFIGAFTDNRNVLLIKPEGGVIKRTKKYQPEENVLKTTAIIDLKADKSMTAKVHRESTGLAYYYNYTIQFELPKDQKIHYKEHWRHINSLEIGGLKLQDNKDAATFVEDIQVTSRAYSKKVGNRLLVAPNVFGKDTETLPKYENRTTPFVIERGYVHSYEQMINIPKGYYIDRLPENMALESEFGEYSYELEKINDTQIKCKRYLKIMDGRFPKEKYETYRGFRHSINKIDNTKIILRKKTE